MAGSGGRAIVASVRKASTQRVPSENEIIELAELRAPVENVVVDFLNRAQDRETPTRKHHDVAPQTPIDHPAQFRPAHQEVASEGNLVSHQGDEFRSGSSDRPGLETFRESAQSGGRKSEALHVATRQIDAAVGEIDRDILPEIGELQSAADEIGESLPLGIAITK